MSRISDIFHEGGTNLAGPGSLNSSPGWLWQQAGKSGEWAAKQFTKAFPKEIAGALQRGIADGNLSGLLGEAFANAPFAAFKQKILDTFKDLGNEISKSWEKADQAAFNYGKRIGLAGDQVARLRNEMIRFSNEAQIGIKFGKSIEEAIKLQENYSVAVGRNLRLTNEQTKSMMALSAVVGDEMAVKFSASLDNFGMSTLDAGEMMTKMFNNSVKQGISLDKYAKNVSDHLTMAQKYTFKNGVNGLMSMAEKAAKLRVDMDMVAQMSEKMSTIGGAVDVSAQLQVLGGAFTQFADPMKLLYGSLNDMEGLTDQLTNLTKSMGRFNKDTGEIEIATFDKLRLKQAASAMGADYGKLIEQVTTQARRGEVEYQMKGLSNIPQQYQELIMNMATFQNGVAGVRGKNGEFKALSKLENADFEALVSNSKTDSQNIADIAEMLRGMTDVKQGEEKAKENLAAQKYATQAESIKNVYNLIGHNAEALNKLIAMQLGSHVWNSFGSPMLSGGKKAMGGIIKMLTTLSANGGLVRTHSAGGFISDGVPGKEMLLNSAQHGEFIMNAESTKRFFPILNAMNFNPSSLMGNMGGGIGGNLVTSLMIETLKENLSTNKVIRRAMLRDADGNTFAERYARMYKPEKYEKMQEFSEKMGEVSEKLKEVGGKVGKIMMHPATMGVTAGLVTGISTWKEHASKGTTVLNKSKALGDTIGSSIGAAAGAAIGTAFGGPIGTMIGAKIGEAAGGAIGTAIGNGNEGRRSRKFNEYRTEIQNEEGRGKYASLKGSFSTRELRALANALQDGEIGENELKMKHLKDKLIQTGNEGVLAKKKYANGGLLIGPSHMEGGINISEGEGGEFIINKEATKRSISTLTKINDGSINDSNIKPREPMGRQMRVNGVETESYKRGPEKVEIKPIDINISGSIKLETNGQNFDISKELMNNPFFINKLTDLITKQININDNGAFDKKSYYQRHTSI